MKLRIVSAVALALLAPATGQTASDVERSGRRGFVHSGSLEPGEVDRHAVRLRAGEVLTVSLRDAEGGEFHDPLLGVFAPSHPEQPLARDDDGGPGFLPRLALRAPQTGVFTVAVTGFGDDDFDGSGHGERLGYRLVVAVEKDPPQLVEREAGARRPSADLLRLRHGAAVVSGRLAPGDSDVFELWLDADATLTASVFEPGGGAFHDPVLRLRDTRGQLLAENDDGGPGFLANLAFEAKRRGHGRRPIPVLLELTGFDPDAAGAATHVEDFAYQLVISLDHFASP